MIYFEFSVLMTAILCTMYVEAADPVFTAPPPGGGNGSIPENMTVGTSIFFLEATDTDGTVLTFTILSQNPPSPAFTINEEDALIVPAGLDYESTTSFNLTFSVTNDDTIVYTTYILTILDVDDEAPVFNPSTFSANVTDALPNGRVILIVSATDVDSESFSYYIEERQSFVAIDDAGRLTIANQLGVSLRIGTDVTLMVVADNGTNVGSATVTFTIKSKDPNYEVIRLPQNGGMSYIPEDTAVGSTIALGQTYHPMFSIDLQNPPSPIFNVSETYELIVPSGLDYETTKVFLFSCRITSGTYIYNKRYTLMITDVDDTAPVFNPSTYAETITDSTATGTTIITVTAVDLDTLILSYSVQGPQTTFAINSAGYITVADQSGLTELIGSPINMMIDASDGIHIGSATIAVTIVASPCSSSPCQNDGTCTNTGTTTYICTCLDGYVGINCESVDNSGRPVFVTPPPSGGNGSIAETEAIGSSILVFDATDTDGDILTFSIASQNPATPAFTINEATDKLVVPLGVDYETTTLFSFTFSVSDGSSVVTTPYNLTIIDVDDTAPVFNPSNYAATIFESTATGTTIVVVTATDIDSESFSFNIQGSQTIFAINSAGHITIVDQLGLAGLILIGSPINLVVDANDGINTGSALISIIFEVSPCNSSPCQNGGTCFDNTEGFTCNCLTWYIGQTCSDASPCNSSPCQNGGTCIDSTEGFTCNCLTGYIGQTCSNVPAQTTTTPTDSGITDKGLIVAISVSVCVAVVCLGALVIYCCIQRRNSNKKQKKDEHSTSAVRMEVIPDYGVIRDRMLDTKLGMKFTVNTGRVEFAGTDFVAWITRMYMTNNRDAERLAGQMLTCKEILPVGTSCLDFRYDCSYTYPHEVATTTRTYDESRHYNKPQTDIYETLRSTGTDSFTTYITLSGHGNNRPNVYETLKPPEQRRVKEYDRLNETS